MTSSSIKADIQLPKDSPNSVKFLHSLHSDFILKYGKHEENGSQEHFDFVMSEFLRINGIYWAVTTMDLLGELSKLEENEIMEFVLSCFCCKSGGFAPSPSHDPHILNTLSAIQIAVTFNRLNELDIDKIETYIYSLFRSDEGCFVGDSFGEERDTRFSFCAVASLSLIGKLDQHKPNAVKNKNYHQGFDLQKAVNFVVKSMNFDFGYGSGPSNESHAGYIYCCLSFLAITDNLNLVPDSERLGWWLAERQLTISGGLNGRPEKLPDVCYAWWVLASLAIINKLHWISFSKIKRFILCSQDVDVGGFSDRPGNISDPFHTLFGIAGLSLIQSEVTKELNDDGPPPLASINPVFCMRQSILDSMGIKVTSL